MDYLKINGQYRIPYPNGFTMKKTANITSEYTTITGKRMGDINGWIYEDQTFSWDTLKEEELQILLRETNPMNGTFTLNFVDAEDGEKTINAMRVSRVLTKTRFKRNGYIVWKDVQMEVRFPDAYTT